MGRRKGTEAEADGGRSGGGGHPRGCFGCEAAPNVGRQRPVLLHEREERKRQRHARDADHDQHISGHGADVHHSAVAQACDGRREPSRAEPSDKQRYAASG
jgi:hypothetical protein